MRIGLFVDSFYPMIDGVVNVVDNYAKGLLKYGEVTVFCPLIDNTPITDKPYKVVQCHSLSVKGIDYSLPLPKLDQKFVKLLNNSKLDVVHIHSPFTVGEAGVRYAKRKKIPLFATIHSQFRQDFENALKSKVAVELLTSSIMKVFNSCDLCYALNVGMKELYLSEYSLTAPCVIRQNATSHREVSLAYANECVEKAFNIPKDQLLFLFVGRINYLKGVDLIVKALKILKEKGIDFKMIFAGTGQDENRLNELIEGLSLKNEIIMAGRITDEKLLQSLYKRAKLLLFPSLYDANSLVQIEAACQGVPTVFSKGAKTASEISDGVNGFLAEYDPLSFAQKIMRILDDDALYEKVSKNAKATLYKTWDEVIEETFEDYITAYTKQK